VEILDIHKLRDEMGEKTVAVEAFEERIPVRVFRNVRPGDEGSNEGPRGRDDEAARAWMSTSVRTRRNGTSDSTVNSPGPSRVPAQGLSVMRSW
jgi:hypothetical protein